MSIDELVTQHKLEQEFEAMPTSTRGSGRPKDGRYLADDGERVPSVTTVKDCLHPRGLFYGHWRNGKEGREFGDWGLPAAAIGTQVHRWADSFIHGEPLRPIPADLEEHRAKIESSFGAFRRWWEASQFTIIVTELPIVSEEYRYAGTPDAILRDSEGRVCVGDWKSSKALYWDYLTQIASYGRLWNEKAPEHARITGGYHLVRFDKEHGDFEHRHFLELDDGDEMFLLLRRAYDLKRKLEARVK